MTRKPVHPGELLRAGYMEPLALSLESLAGTLKIPLEELRVFVNGERSVSVDLAMRLAAAFSTTPDFWLNAQRNLDIWKAYQGHQAWREVKRIHTASSELEAI